MTIQRRLLLLLLGIAFALWALASTAAYIHSRDEINELFDTQQVRLAEQALAHAIAMGLPQAGLGAAQAPNPLNTPRHANQGKADPDDMSIAIWRANGELLWRSEARVQLPFENGSRGFSRARLGNDSWVLYYTASADGQLLVATGQHAEERDELLESQLLGQLIPWLLTLPVLALAIWGALRIVFSPLRELATEISRRAANDLSPIEIDRTPNDVRPLLESMNALFVRIETAIAYERRLSADASHELRTPLAALRAQWDAAHLAKAPAERDHAFAQLGVGIDRLAHLVDQLLRLTALDASGHHEFAKQLEWHRIVETVISESLPLADARHAEIAVEWPEAGQTPFALAGDDALMATLLRNLVDNALRYGGDGNQVTIRLGTDSLALRDRGPGLPRQVRERVGERFLRLAGQTETGAGIGLSIVLRIAQLHGLQVRFETQPERGLCVHISRADENRLAPSSPPDH